MAAKEAWERLLGGDFDAAPRVEKSSSTIVIAFRPPF